MNGLELPNQFAGPDVQAKNRIGVKILPRPVPAEVGGGWRAQRNIHVAELFIGGERGPGSHITHVLRGTFAPRLIPGLTLMRHNMEGPEQFTGVYIETADILRFRLALKTAIAVSARGLAAAVAADHDHVVDNKRTGPAEVGRVVFGVAVQREAAVVAEYTITQAGLWIQRIQILAADHNDAFLLAVGPPGDPAGALAGGFLQGGFNRLLDPVGFAGGRVKSLCQTHAVGRNQNAIDHDRRAAKVIGGVQVGVFFFDGGIDGGPRPGDLEIFHVAGVDLVEGGITVEGLISSVGPPFGRVGFALLRAQRTHAGNAGHTGKNHRHFSN